MNRYTLNGSPLGGIVYGAVLATALVVCSTVVTASVDRVHIAAATISSTSSIVATVGYTLGAQATLTGGVQVAPFAVLKQTSSASISGGSTVQAYVRRVVDAEVFFVAGATISAIPASVLATSDLAVSSNVQGQATRVQPAYASLAGGSTVVQTGTLTLTKKPVAVIQAQAKVRGEPHIGIARDVYADISANCAITVVDLCTRYVVANLSNPATVSATATLVQPGKSLPFTNAIVITTEAFVVSSPIGFCPGNAFVSASGFITRQPVANLTNGALVSATAKQNYAAKANAIGSAVFLVSAKQRSLISAVIAASGSIDADITVIPQGVANITGVASVIASPSSAIGLECVINPSSTVIAAADAVNARRVDAAGLLPFGSTVVAGTTLIHATGAVVGGSSGVNAVTEALNLRRVLSTVEITGDAQAVFNSLRTLTARAFISGNSDMTGAISDIIRFVTSDIQGTASIYGDGAVSKDARANIDASSTITSVASLLMTASAQPITGTVIVYASTIANPEAIDPEERTFIRPSNVVDFIRPFIETEFKRAA